MLDRTVLLGLVLTVLGLKKLVLSSLGLTRLGLKGLVQGERIVSESGRLGTAKTAIPPGFDAPSLKTSGRPGRLTTRASAMIRKIASHTRFALMTALPGLAGHPPQAFLLPHREA